MKVAKVKTDIGCDLLIAKLSRSLLLTLTSDKVAQDRNLHSTANLQITLTSILVARIISQGIVDGSASKPALIQDTNHTI